MPNILSEKNYALGKWGLREAFNQNSLMQLFNGDRRIVQWSTCLVLTGKKTDKTTQQEILNEFGEFCLKIGRKGLTSWEE